MSRSGYGDCDGDDIALGRWRGQVASAIRGQRGQAFLRELIDALDAMSEKRLIGDALEEEGNVCAIGSVGIRRGVDMSKLDPGDPDGIAATFGIASQLVQEIEYENDENTWRWEDGRGERRETPEEKWNRMRRWAVSQIKSSRSAPRRQQP